MKKSFALYGADVTYVTLELSEEEYNGIKKLMDELHDSEGNSFDRNVDIKEYSDE